ncbi:hypothetical protein SERLA73DRAFT_187887 [Serpula lacrymans var. lacrymans S7.3]|uniref:Uncharacterized protein n=2 Tax=Serpula lacrymans var. lacrymans TaxID=341189 RepID=F8QAM9_SERL3|nr:uncharacterized protein SERLADRAFT_477773 [Serpula lacrymans var. lacrymans S7.9]EGN94819.1 hypothetical protein SERLA73DRAFT_187887 [Serpula lacrymans var. lacrymans S7.3]EGO20318.1 hypothetical protein SERLADRAFT_477773 [Serpula lacrymans var. lacrymans S7.9]
MSSTITSILSPPTSAPTSAPPPITQLLPILRTTGSKLFSALSYLAQFLYSSSGIFLQPLHILLPVALWLLAPAIILFDIILDALVFTPYNLVSGALSIFYPLYVFCGAACISGLAIGVVGRTLVSLLTKAIGSGQNHASEVTSPVSPLSPLEPQPLRRRRSRQGKAE